MSIDPAWVNLAILLIVLTILIGLIVWMGMMRVHMLELKASLLSWILTVSIYMNGHLKEIRDNQDKGKLPPPLGGDGSDNRKDAGLS